MLIYSNKCLEAQLEETGFTSARRKQHAAVPEIIGLTGLHRLACIVNYTYLQLLNHTFRDSCRVSSDLFRGVCTLPLPSLSCPYTLNHARPQDRTKYDTLRQGRLGSHQRSLIPQPVGPRKEGFHFCKVGCPAAHALAPQTL